MSTRTLSLIDVRTRLWCRECRRSSAVALGFAGSSGDQLTVSTVKRCMDCGGENVEETS